MWKNPAVFGEREGNEQTLVQFLMKKQAYSRQESVNSTPRKPLHIPVMAVAEDDNVWIMCRIERKTAMPLARAIASRSKHALPIFIQTVVATGQSKPSFLKKKMDC